MPVYFPKVVHLRFLAIFIAGYRYIPEYIYYICARKVHKKMY